MGNSTNFYVSTDFLPGTTTGVSAADRMTTARAFCDLSNPAEAFSKPGHLFPLCARSGGVLERPGHTESTFDMCRISGMTHCGLLAELMHDDGTMYRKEASLEFARKHRIAIVTVEQIIEYRRQHPLQTTPSVIESLLAAEASKRDPALPGMQPVAGMPSQSSA